MKWIIVGIAFFGLMLDVTIGPSTAEGAESSAAVLQEMNTFFEHAVDGGKLPGVIAVIARKGEITHASSSGYSSSGDPTTTLATLPDTIFRLFSMSKPVTAAAVMLLLDEGLIQLDDPVSNYLPEYTNMKVLKKGQLVTAASPITIRHLLTHTSGVSYLLLQTPVTDHYVKEDVFAISNRLSETTEAHVKRLAKLPLVAHPGAEWSYGESFGILGRLIEVVSGQSFGQFLQTRLFVPLKMTDTGFFVPEEKVHRLAALYQADSNGDLVDVSNGPFGGDYTQKPPLEYGGAGLVGTPLDYLKFAQMLLNDGQVDGRQLISQASIEMLKTNQLGNEMGETPLESLGNPEFSRSGVGFGFGGYVVHEHPGEGWNGSLGEYSWGGWADTHFWIDPKEGLVALFFTQVLPGSGAPANWRPKFREFVYRSLVKSAPN